MARQLREDEIIQRAKALPAFPRVVNDILATLDDDGATLGMLVGLVERDPVIAAQILSIANTAAVARDDNPVRDVRKAVSLIGQSRVRKVVLGLTLAQFAREARVSTYFWEHSVAVGVGALELAGAGRQSPGLALVAGLLHDIGQLWMSHFCPLEFQMVRAVVAEGRRGIVEVERQYFGMDHCAIGSLLAAHWGLPEAVAEAIALHHDPDAAPQSGSLAAIVHVAEVLANALDLCQREENLVSHLSEAACARLGIDWQQDFSGLFGRIEARSEYASRVFR